MDIADYRDRAWALRTMLSADWADTGLDERLAAALALPAPPAPTGVKGFLLRLRDPRRESDPRVRMALAVCPIPGVPVEPMQSPVFGRFRHEVMASVTRTAREPDPDAETEQGILDNLRFLSAVALHAPTLLIGYLALEGVAGAASGLALAAEAREEGRPMDRVEAAATGIGTLAAYRSGAARAMRPDHLRPTMVTAIEETADGTGRLDTEDAASLLRALDPLSLFVSRMLSTGLPGRYEPVVNPRHVEAAAGIDGERLALLAALPPGFPEAADQEIWRRRGMPVKPAARPLSR